ncbi:hypothetical protein L4D19_02810 [Photobacterium kasasachensis]
MIVNFSIFKSNYSWTSVIHQLNSDILTRHVLMKGNVDNVGVSFSFCEETREGAITNNQDDVIGSFSISS